MSNLVSVWCLVPTCLFEDCNTVRVEELAIALATFAKLKLEAALLVKDLYAVVVRVCDYDVILCVDSDAARLRELALHDAKLTKLAVVNHLLTPDLRLGWVDTRRDKLSSEIHHLIRGGRGTTHTPKHIAISWCGHCHVHR